MPPSLRDSFMASMIPSLTSTSRNSKMGIWSAMVKADRVSLDVGKVVVPFMSFSTHYSNTKIHAQHIVYNYKKHTYIRTYTNTTTKYELASM